MVIGLIALGAWISLMAIVVALCALCGDADGLTPAAFVARESARAQARRHGADPATAATPPPTGEATTAGPRTRS
jgi:hypothetical protein